MARLGDTQDRPLWVKFADGNVEITGDVQVDFGDLADLDTGAGTDEHPVLAIGFAGPGGHVVWDGRVDTGLDAAIASLLAEAEATADILQDVWDDLANALRVQIQGIVPVAQSGTWTVATGLEDDLSPIAREATQLLNHAELEAIADVLVDAWDDLGNRLRVNVTATVLPPGAATESTLQQIRDNTDQLEGFLDGMEGLITSTNSALATLNAGIVTLQGYTDQLEGYVDGLEALVAATNSALATVNAHLGTLEGYTDTLEALIASTNSALTTTNAHLTTLEGYTDTLEALMGTTNTTLASVNSNLVTLQGLVDGLEGFTDGIEGLLTTIRDNADMVETLLTNVSNVLLDVWDDPNNALRTKPVANAPPPQNGASTAPTAGAAASTILAASATRRGALVQNDGLGIVRLAIGGTTPTAALGHRLLPGDVWWVAGGAAVKAIREAAPDSLLQVSELTD